MPRDNNGNYSLAAGNPVIAGTVIESVWANTTLDDIALALSNSLDRDGNGGMRAPLVLDGSVPTDPDHAISLQYILDLQDPTKNPDPFPVYLLASGERELIEGYIPEADQDVATKKFVEDTVAGGGDPTIVNKVKVSLDDAVSDYLEGKIIAGANMTITKAADVDGIETLVLAANDVEGGVGFLAPVNPPSAAGELVAYLDNTGLQAADPLDEVSTPGTKLVVGTHRLTSNGTVLDIETVAGGGTTVHILPGGGDTEAASMSIVVPADGGPDSPLFIQSAGAPLEMIAPEIYVNDMKWPAVGTSVQGAYMTAISATELAFVATTGDTPILYTGGDTPGGPV